MLLGCFVFALLGPLSRGRGQRHTDPQDEAVLSIGRIFHHLKLDGEEIIVKRIWPKYDVIKHV